MSSGQAEPGSKSSNRTRSSRGSNASAKRAKGESSSKGDASSRGSGERKGSTARSAKKERSSRDGGARARASSSGTKASKRRETSAASERRVSEKTQTDGTEAGDATSGKYVYCLIRSNEQLSFGEIGIGVEPAEVHTVNYRNIAAVVSDARIEVYDPTRENVLAHQHVNEIVMRDHTVIPMSFGTVFKTSEDIVELLRSAYDAFQDVLMKMENKVEFGLKVLWDPEVATALIERDDEEIRRLKEEISSRKGSTYFARVQYGRLVDARLSERSERYVKEIFEALRDVSVASRSNKPIGDRMILNAAFLVDRDREGEFDSRLKKIGKQYNDLTFRYTGPWPPYNFVNIRLKLERVEEDR
ncbi:MAG TPA: GvpL/GvpF family gas vesicle protein [Planctomycetota bacterium]|nr:GvpL/GvpF family gas vesicle protein [Planctomycetota bacterium]